MALERSKTGTFEVLLLRYLQQNHLLGKQVSVYRATPALLSHASQLTTAVKAPRILEVGNDQLYSASSSRLRSFYTIV